MSAKPNDQNFGDGEISQDLIDQMLNGAAVEADPWSDDSLQAEINAARVAAGVMIEDESPFVGAPLAAVPTPISAARASAPTPTAVHPIQFMPLTPDLQGSDQSHGIELLMDVALEVSVELGRSHMSIGEILALRTGSVIELDKLAGEPVDVSVNGTLIARGEVVVVDEKFGVRITEVVSKSRRLATVG
jgi:flagellar motor switch protein FliN/FliY